MFDEIFKRWVNENTITQDDIIPILQEYVIVFEKGNFNPQSAIAFAQMASNQWINGQNMLTVSINNAMKMIGIKKGYH